MGVVWALVGGQPLCIIGVTMPVAIFTSVCYKLAEALDAPFLPWLGWVCIFSGARRTPRTRYSADLTPAPSFPAHAGLMHIALAIFGAVRLLCCGWTESLPAPVLTSHDIARRFAL